VNTNRVVVGKKNLVTMISIFEKLKRNSLLKPLFIYLTYYAYTPNEQNDIHFDKWYY